MTSEPKEKELWMEVRRGLLLALGAIETHYGVVRKCPHCQERKPSPPAVSTKELTISGGRM